MPDQARRTKLAAEQPHDRRVKTRTAFRLAMRVWLSRAQLSRHEARGLRPPKVSLGGPSRCWGSTRSADQMLKTRGDLGRWVLVCVGIDTDQCPTVCQLIHDYRIAIAGAEAAREDVARAVSSPAEPALRDHMPTVAAARCRVGVTGAAAGSSLMWCARSARRVGQGRTCVPLRGRTPGSPGALGRAGSAWR